MAADQIDTLYVFAIGGSGERVMRSLVMLVSGGMNMNCNSIQPIFIDTDKNSRALLRANELINNYRNIREKFLEQEFLEKDKLTMENCMFHIDIKKPIIFDIDGTNIKNLKAMVNPDSEDVTQNIREEFNVLYSGASQNMTLSYGFVGNPSIGSTVLNKTLELPEFKNIQINANDAVFIVSSIFGGTGAAGFPLLVNWLRQNLKDGVRIGALSLFPYFNLYDVNDNSQIEQELKSYDVEPAEFAVKTKAALLYYSKYVKCLSSLYYLGPGDSSMRSTFPKHKGGNLQDNPASMIEVLAAKAVSHFSQTAHSLETRMRDNNSFNTQYYEYFLKDLSGNEQYYNLDTIDPDIEFKKVFVRLALLKYIWKNVIPGWIETSGNQWCVYANLTDKTKYDEFMGDSVSAYLSDVEHWSREMKAEDLREHGGAHRLKFDYFDFDVTNYNSQENIGLRFKPSIQRVKKGIFGSSDVAIDMLGIANNSVTKLGGKGASFSSTRERHKFWFCSTLNTIENIVSDTHDQKINLVFNANS